MKKEKILKERNVAVKNRRVQSPSLAGQRDTTVCELQRHISFSEKPGKVRERIQPGHKNIFHRFQAILSVRSASPSRRESTLAAKQ